MGKKRPSKIVRPKRRFNRLAMVIMGTAALACGILVLVARAGALIVADNFDGPDGLITNNQYYVSAPFPNRGSSATNNPSVIWEGDSGSFYRKRNWGYSGRPLDWPNKYFFRFNTRNLQVGNAKISWDYRSAPFGKDGYPVEGSDAVDVWLRYRTQYNLYVFQFDRTDNGIQAKRKIPAQGWSGPANLVSNKGVYYTLPTDSLNPTGTGKFLIRWSDVANRLPAAEQSKPNFPNLAHDGLTRYHFKVTAFNLPGGRVQIQAFRGGALVYSATDDGRSGVAANGNTQGQHLDAGYYNTVTGWKSAWGRPLSNPGATGFRADNIKFWLDNFTARAF